MAKQHGIYKVDGKLGDLSYTYSRNGGYQVKTLNPNMSERVKNDPEFVNTRRNANELKISGIMAGKLISALSARYRYLLHRNATAKYIGEIRKAINNDTQNPWGQRTVQESEMSLFQETFAKLQKNPFPAETILDMQKFIYGAPKDQFIVVEQSILYPQSLIDWYRAKGIEYVESHIFEFAMEIPHFNSSTGDYENPVVSIYEAEELERIEPVSHYGDMVMIGLETDLCKVPIRNTFKVAGGLLVVLTPLYRVGNRNYVAQNLCSAAWVEIQP